MIDPTEIKIVSLFSGSKGNCTYCSVCGYEFLIDAGGTSKRICDSLKAVGSSPERISDIFITHEHTDHTSALNVFCKRTNATVHMVSLSAKYVLAKCPSLNTRIVEHPLLYSHSFGNINISSFPLSHDSVACVGYLVTVDGEKLFASATDTGFFPSDALATVKGCRYVICEANHDLDMLIFGMYPPHLKERIMSCRGHLSNTDCAALVSSLLDSGSKKIMLAHLSEENNTKAKALSEVLSICGNEAKEKICVASQRASAILA